MLKRELSETLVSLLSSVNTVNEGVPQWRRRQQVDWWKLMVEVIDRSCFRRSCKLIRVTSAMQLDVDINVLERSLIVVANVPCKIVYCPSRRAIHDSLYSSRIYLI